MADDEPKIIVDGDWKAEAQQEKERLASEETETDAAQLPEPTFLEIVNMIAMQAIMCMGGMKTPDGREIPADLSVARHHVGLLEILQLKTKGNLDETEEKVMNQTVHELRMSFVQASESGSADQPGTST